MIVAVCAVLTVQSASGADRSGSFAVKGIGTLTCVDITKLATSGSADMTKVEGWLMGYFTAQNQLQEGMFDILPWQTGSDITAQAVAICRQDEALKLQAVAESLVEGLRAGAIQERQQLTRVTIGNHVAFLYSSVVRRVQGQLARRAGYAGRTDGVFDGSAIAAIVRFQKSNELPATGLLDQKTLLTLIEE